MPRALVASSVLDAMIRNKLANTPSCEGVQAMPVVLDASRDGGCNWKVPGWTGDLMRLATCGDQIEGYVRFLATQFDIPDRPA